MTRLRAALAALAVLATSMSAAAQTFVFHMDGSQVVPPAMGGASGGCFGQFDPPGATLSLTCVHNVVGATVMNIHRGVAGANGAIAFDLGDPSTGQVTATWTSMTPSDIGDLLAGGLYIDVHSAGHPAGEIRGQILPRTVDTVAFTATGAQAVPPDASPATANCLADLDGPATSLAIQCTHDLAGATAAHVHQAPFGGNGPIVFTLPSAASPLSASMPVTPALVAAYAATFLYLDIHSAGADVIRGQIFQASLFADLAVTKTGPALAIAGSNVIYTVSVTNNGPGMASAVSVADPSPPNTTFVSNSGGCTTSYPCGLGALGPGQTVTITSTYTVGPTFSGTVTNTATVSAATSDPAPGNNSQSTSATVSAVPAVTTFSGPSATGSGTVTASFTGGGTSCTYGSAALIGPPPGAPPIPPTAPAAGIMFLHGLFDFTTSNCVPASTLVFTITYPAALPPGTQYWKYGPTAGDPAPHWYVLPATISGSTVTLSITDGGLGDDDLAPNGTIVDQGGPGTPVGSGIIPTPTLSEWAIILLALLLGAMGAHRIRGPKLAA